MRGPKKIPTLLGLALVAAIVGAMFVSSETIAKLPIRALTVNQPKDVQITNVSDTSFTVTWITTAPATGQVIVTKEDKEIPAFDERDGNGKLAPYITHSVTIRNLQGDTQYLVKILSDGKTYLDHDQPYHARTAPALTSPGNLGPAYGSVTSPDGQAAEGALVFLSLEGSQTLSTLVKPSGAWIIPLNLIRSIDATSYLPVTTERLTETLLVRSDGQEASAITDTLNDSPVPVMVLGKNYDFRKQQAKTPAPLALVPSTTPFPAEQPSVLGSQTEPSTPTSYRVSLTSPAEGASVPSEFPLIQGTGIPYKSVTITLGITNPTSDTTIVASDGILRYTPKTPLAPGKQTVTMTTVDSTGTPVAITHSFEILKSGTQVLGTATPSATLSSTLTPTPISTLAGQPLPTSATTLPTIMLITFGLILFTGGLVAFVIL